MKKFFKNLSFKKICFAILTFILALCIVFCAFATVVRTTVFNRDFLSDTLNTSQYYKDLCVEITESLTDLGDASGLDRSFFDGLVSEVLVRQDTQAYINSFYSREKLKVNTSQFDDRLLTALNAYIKKHHIKNVDDENIDGFLASASEIYSNHVKISYFASVQDLLLDNDSIFTVIIIILTVISAGLIVILIFLNEWKHKGLRYVFTAVNSAGLFLFILPFSIRVSGVVHRIALISRSMSDMVYSMIGTILGNFFVISTVLIVISIAVWAIHARIRRKATL